MKKRILYLSCHSVLEYDEILLLDELGYYVFSPGAYVEPANPGGDSLRPGLSYLQYDPEDLRLWREISGDDDNQRKENITASFVKRFDAVIVMHMPSWINCNWRNLSVRPVIWRTIGQSISSIEKSLAEQRKNGMLIVRYSPREQTIPDFIGGDATIRFYKDPKEFQGWRHGLFKVLTINQLLKQRCQACNYNLWERVTGTFDRTLIGLGNDGIVGWQGKATYEDVKEAMRNHSAYFYIGTHPASYTLNFIEAWMTGIPVVAIGPQYGNTDYLPGHNLYEIPDLIQSGVNGYISDDVSELQAYLFSLLCDRELAEKISAAGRAAAIQHFGKDTIKAQWEQFLAGLLSQSTSQQIQGFLYSGNWFERRYRARSDTRYSTFKIALNLLLQRTAYRTHPACILETGCARIPDDWGSGQSTLLFAEFVKRYGGKVFSVDLSPNSCRAARMILKDFDDLVSVHESDSLSFLSLYKQWLAQSSTSGVSQVDLLYLDSFDYPYWELVQLYGGGTDIEEAKRRLAGMSDDEIVAKHGKMILPCQEHCLNEAKLGMELLHERSIILIDDNNLPGGGKPRLAKRWLFEQGWHCLYDFQQTVWVRN